MHEETKKFFDRLDAIDDKIISRIEKRLESEEKVSSEMLGEMADMSRDLREGKKAEAKTWHYLQESRVDEEL